MLPAHTFDLIDHDLLAELELTMNLIEAASATPGRLTRCQVDRILEVRP